MRCMRRRFLGFVSGTPAGKWLVREVMTTINTAKAQESFKDVCLALSRLQGVRYHICGLQVLRASHHACASSLQLQLWRSAQFHYLCKHLYQCGVDAHVL